MDKFVFDIKSAQETIETLKTLPDYNPSFFGKNPGDEQFEFRFKVTNPYLAAMFFGKIFYDFDYESIGITDLEMGFSDSERTQKLVNTIIDSINDFLGRNTVR